MPRRHAAAGLPGRGGAQGDPEALQGTRFNRTAAAKVLGVTFRSLRYRMERLGLND